jgi:hypothetical protein
MPPRHVRVKMSLMLGRKFLIIFPFFKSFND